MKRTGIIILLVGLFITIFTGFNFITKEKVIDIGKLEITHDKKHGLVWSPLIGVGVMVIGGIMLLVASKKN